jgi:MFS family permease
MRHQSASERPAHDAAGALAEPPIATAFWTYWSAGTVSSVGTQVTAVALPLTAVSVLHASALEVSLLTAASWIAWLVIGLPAGVIVGRLPLRETQVVMDLLRAAALAMVPIAWWLGGLTLLQLAVTALVVSFASVLFDVGNMTLLPAVVPKEELASRNSLVSGTHATTQLGGPSLGGVLVQLLGAVPTLLVDAASYLVSGILMGRLPARRVPQPAQRIPMAELIREGWHFVMRHPVMRPCLEVATVVNFICGALMALTPVYLVRNLGAPAALVGLLIATEGVGSLVGAAVCTRANRWIGSAPAVVAASVISAVSALLLPLVGDQAGMALFGLGNAGFAAGVVVFSINTRTHRQTASPPELLSRVMATVRFVSWGAIPLGALGAGLAAAVLGVHAALWVTCAAASIPAAITLLSPIPRLRELSDPV